MILKRDAHIYLLKNPDVDQTRLKKKAEEKGYIVKEVEDEGEFLDMLEQTEPGGDAGAESSYLLAHNLPEGSDKTCFKRFQHQVQWLAETVNEMNIGLIISNGIYPVMIHPAAAKMVQMHPASIQLHPLSEKIQEDQRKPFLDNIKQLSQRKIHHYAEDIQIYTPESSWKDMRLFGRPLDLDHLPLVAEYLIEKQNGQNKSPSVDDNILVGEIHHTLSGLSGILNIREKQRGKQTQTSNKARRRPGYNLTQREMQILQFIYEGYTSEKIAKKLYISKRTVESHRANILNKTSTKNTADLIRYAVHHKML